MNQNVKPIALLLLLLTSSLVAGSPVFGQTDSEAVNDASKNIATGHSYFGFDLGITGSDYLGSKNFLWGIQSDPSLGTYLPYNNLGTGIGFVAGIKAGLEVSTAFDIEGKVRFLTNYTSKQQAVSGIILDPDYPTNISNGTNNYSITLSNVDFALLGHIRLANQFYAIGGFSASTLVVNTFSASQTISGSYLRLTTHTNSNFSEQQTAPSTLANWFTGYRGDIQVGAGTVYRLGATNMLLDAEILVGIPLTSWLTKAADSSLNSTAKMWLQPTSIVDPHLWYATLTIGLRLPFSPLPPPPAEPQAVQPSIPASPTATRQPEADTAGTTVLSGHIIDAQTGKPVSSANLTAVNLSDNKVVWTGQTDSNGSYSIRVHGPGKFSVTADKNGFLFGTAYFEVDSNGRILNSHPDIKLENIVGGKTRLLVFFASDKAELQPSSTPELNHAADLMKSVPNLKVEIAGYSDTSGTASHNKALSLQRANSVRDYLIGQGIDASRITAQGYGSASPIAPNNTEEGRAENRRVEFIVVSH